MTPPTPAEVRAAMLRNITDETERRNWTTTDLARAAGVAQPTVRSITTRPRRSGATCNLYTAIRIAAALGLTLDELITQRKRRMP